MGAADVAAIAKDTAKTNRNIGIVDVVIVVVSQTIVHSSVCARCCRGMVGYRRLGFRDGLEFKEYN